MPGDDNTQKIKTMKTKWYSYFKLSFKATEIRSRLCSRLQFNAENLQILFLLKIVLTVSQLHQKK